MTAELVVRKYRKQVPEAHRTSLDTRVAWLWNQRFGTVQTVWQESPDQLDVLAAMMLIQCVLGCDLNNIQLIFKRLEGGAQEDTIVAEADELVL